MSLLVAGHADAPVSPHGAATICRAWQREPPAGECAAVGDGNDEARHAIATGIRFPILNSYNTPENATVQHLVPRGQALAA